MIELTPGQQQFVDAQVSAGAFKAPAEVIAAALEMLAARQREYDHLQSAIGAVERGEFDALDIDDIKRRGSERRSAQE